LSEPASSNRITVSEDKLDAKLARLELNLIDRITTALAVKADQKYVEQLHARIHTVEGTLQATAMLLPAFKEIADDVEGRLRILERIPDDVEPRLRGLERFRYAIPSAAVLAAAAAIFVALHSYLT
jgi:hypothetical protein